jgi:hypothetical protein
MLEVRGTEEGCRLELEAEGSRMGKLVLLSAVVDSAESGGGTSPRLETRLSRARVIVDLERLWWLPLLLLLGGESVEDWMEAYEGCLCRCGLGERRDVMGMCVYVARGRCHQKRGGDRMTEQTDGRHLLATIILPLLFAPSSLIVQSGGGVCCAACFVARVQYSAVQ